MPVMGVFRRIKEGWIDISNEHTGNDSYWYLSPLFYGFKKNLFPLIVLQARGNVLDAGGGRGAYQSLTNVESYTRMDIRHDYNPDVVGDIFHTPLKPESFDTILFSQVLEHLPYPLNALKELRTLLKPDGTLILSVPHLSWLHNEPNDYYRFTHHGLKILLTDAGFRIDIIERSCGILSFFFHLFITFYMPFLYYIPFLKKPLLFITKYLSITIFHLDKKIGIMNILPVNYIVIAKR